MHFPISLSFAILIVSLQSAMSFGASPFLLKEAHEGEPLGQHLLLFKDDSGQQSLSEVLLQRDQFQASTEDYPNWKITSATTWAILQVENPFPTEQVIYIENDYAMTDLITLYSLSDDSFKDGINLGDHQPFSSRPFSYRKAIFRIAVQPGVQEYAISVKTNGPNRMPFRIWTHKKLQHKIAIENFLLGGGFGLIGFMVIYNFFLCVALRSQTYALYVCYGLSFLLLQMGMQGVSGYLFDNFALQEWLSNWGFLAGVQASNFFASLFSIRFLDLKRKLPRINKVFIAFCLVYFVVLVAIGFQINYRYMASATNALTAVSTLSMMGIGLYFTFKRHRPAYFYTLAWTFVLAGGLSFSLSNMGLIPVTFLTTYGSFIGGFCEMALLSFALADRVRHLMFIRNQERDLYIQNLMKKDKETQHSYNQLAKIVFPHQISLMKRGLTLEETMPTGSSEATVIVFDIIDSTNFQAPDKQQFFQRVFLSCYQRMMKRYDEQSMNAEGYRLKELGDGFICSIGFPFRIADHRERNETAILLALDFSQIFQQISIDMYGDQVCYCSIGIAQGDIVGFYPIAGVRAYDLYGKAIVLANRYEHLRRILYPKAQFNVITVQSQVMEPLADDIKNLFEFQDISQRKDLRIRDDQNAKSFYTKQCHTIELRETDSLPA